MTPVGAEYTWGKYSAFVNSFHPKVNRLIWRLDLVDTKSLSYSINHTRACVLFVYVSCFLGGGGKGSKFNFFKDNSIP